jgi:hypothetical protein
VGRDMAIFFFVLNKNAVSRKGSHVCSTRSPLWRFWSLSCVENRIFLPFQWWCNNLREYLMMRHPQKCFRRITHPWALSCKVTFWSNISWLGRVLHLCTVLEAVMKFCRIVHVSTKNAKCSIFISRCATFRQMKAVAWLTFLLCFIVRCGQVSLSDYSVLVNEYFDHIVNISLSKCSPVLLPVSNSTAIVCLFLQLHFHALFSLTNMWLYIRFNIEYVNLNIFWRKEPTKSREDE